MSEATRKATKVARQILKDLAYECPPGYMPEAVDIVVKRIEAAYK